MNQNRIRIGVLSTANIAQRSVIPALLNLPEKFELVGIASRSLEKVQDIASQYNCLAFGSYEEILNRELIDAVYIPLPNSMHFYWVKYALEKNIHVLVEKSMACHFSEVKELNDIARSNNLSLVENFQFRFHSQLSKIKELLDSGIIGNLNYMRSSFEFPPFSDKSNIRYQSKLGGGALLDAGAYPIKITQIFLGLDISVKASSLQYDKEYNVNIGGGAFLQQNEGQAFSLISFGFNNYYQCSIELFGTKGKISTNRIFTAPSNFEPVIQIEQQGHDVVREMIEPNDHFKNMLIYFHQTTTDTSLQEIEYTQNINQSRLLNEF